MPDCSAFHISGFHVRIHNLDDECAARLGEVWRLFAASGEDVQTAGIDLLNLSVRFEGAELDGFEMSPQPLKRTVEGEHVSFISAEGRIDVMPDGEARASVGRGSAAMRAFSLINLMLPAIAWRLPQFGALMLHSGGILLDDRGWLLIGQAGAGKSTFVTYAEEGGATVVSEDLNLVVFEEQGCFLAGAPFRTRNFPGPGPGRWPLAALLLPQHAVEPALEEVPRLAVSAQFQANLPFVGDCWMQLPGGPELLERVDQLAARRLSFARDARFVPLLRAFSSD